MSEEQGKILPIDTNPRFMACDIAILKERLGEMEERERLNTLFVREELKGIAYALSQHRRLLDAQEKKMAEIAPSPAPEYPLTFQDAAQAAFFGKTVERSDGERMSAHGYKHYSYLWADSRGKAHVTNGADFQLGWREVTQ